MIEFSKKLLSFPYKKEFFPVAIASLIPPLITCLACFVLQGDRFLIGVLSTITLVSALFTMGRIFKTILSPLNDSIEDVKLKDNTSKVLSGSMIDTIGRIVKYFNFAKEHEYSILLLQKQAEFDSMQSQINPHFLYNTLDSIRGQALSENAQCTYDMVGSLSRLLRYSISQDKDKITLWEELDSVNNYMNIQRYRFADRFKLIINLHPEDEFILKYKIPKLTIQPLVENAIYHGLNQTVSGGLIKINVTVAQSRLMVLVCDNGTGIEEQELLRINGDLRESLYSGDEVAGATRQTHGNGIALRNVNNRIRLIYGQDYGLMLYSTLGKGTQAELVLPLLENEYEI